MINLEEVKQAKMEEFSHQRKSLLKLLTSRTEIENSAIKPMIKNSTGKLNTCLKSFAKSDQNLETIWDLIQNIAIDDSELVQIERALTKKFRKNKLAKKLKNTPE